jgi:hypothetical protein
MDLSETREFCFQSLVGFFKLLKLLMKIIMTNVKFNFLLFKQLDHGKSMVTFFSEF